LKSGVLIENTRGQKGVSCFIRDTCIMHPSFVCIAQKVNRAKLIDNENTIIIVRGMAPGQVLRVRLRTSHGMMRVRFFWLTPPVFNGMRTIVDIARQATRFPVLSSRFSVPGSQFSVLSSQFPVLSSRFSVLSSQFSVLSSRFLVLSSHSPTTAIAAPSTLPVFGRAHRVLPGCSRYAS
jgi:hypothetical protein